MSASKVISETFLQEIITDPDFNLMVSDGVKNYQLQDIVKMVAFGLSGQISNIEDNLDTLRKRIATAVVNTITSNPQMAGFDEKSIQTIGNILANHIVAKACILNEQFPESGKKQ